MKLETGRRRKEQAQARYDSAAYRKFAPLRRKSATSRMYIVEGTVAHASHSSTQRRIRPRRRSAEERKVLTALAHSSPQQQH